MKKVTLKFLQTHSACKDGVKWVTEQKLINLSGDKVVISLIEAEKAGWANWLITRVMTHKQRIMYAIYAAEKVLRNYENEHPDDDKPRKAIEAAKQYLNDPSAKNKKAARSAAESAAWSAAWSAAEAAWSAAESAAWSAAWSADSATLIDIINYGFTLLKAKP